jgi:hypothetical protein
MEQPQEIKDPLEQASDVESFETMFARWCQETRKESLVASKMASESDGSTGSARLDRLREGNSGQNLRMELDQTKRRTKPIPIINSEIPPPNAPQHVPSLLAEPVIHLPPTIPVTRRFPPPTSLQDISPLEIPSVITGTGEIPSRLEILLPPTGPSITVGLPPLSELLTYYPPVPAMTTSEEPKDLSPPSFDNPLSRVVPDSTVPLRVIPNLSNQVLMLVG